MYNMYTRGYSVHASTCIFTLNFVHVHTHGSQKVYWGGERESGEGDAVICVWVEERKGERERVRVYACVIGGGVTKLECGSS
jgi:hypothetical protein